MAGHHHSVVAGDSIGAGDFEEWLRLEDGVRDGVLENRHFRIDDDRSSFEVGFELDVGDGDCCW